MEKDLKSTPAWKLDKFIQNHLLADTTFVTEAKADIEFLCDFLTERCFQDASHPVRVSRIVMGGCYDEYSMLKGRSEATLVVFFNNLTRFEDQLKRREELIEEIWKHLCQLQHEKQFKLKFEVQSSEQDNYSSLSIKLSSPQLQQEVEFDVQPAYDVLYELKEKLELDCEFYNKIYARLIRECITLRKEGEFSVCFMELQQKFLWNRPEDLRNLLVLVKHWYQLCKEKLGDSLPPQYALELLTVHAWENEIPAKYGAQTARGFQSVLELIIKYTCLRVYWTFYYDILHQDVSSYLHKQLRKERPVILDPADPTRNVAGLNIDGWCELAKEAEAWLKYPCFRHIDETFVGSWEVPRHRGTCTWTCPLLEQSLSDAREPMM
uniref:2 ' -5 ' oligoadenylate synthetase 1H n=1 Tax=Rattus norvegicus TaxID=10116 RepID=D4A6M3_RAT